MQRLFALIPSKHACVRGPQAITPLEHVQAAKSLPPPRSKLAHLPDDLCFAKDVSARLRRERPHAARRHVRVRSAARTRVLRNYLLRKRQIECQVRRDLFGRSPCFKVPGVIDSIE